ncbi:MAG: DUF3737 family protein [Clostridia bacterium]|nr:DUF3737 family protein [Clostridia bacterium]
MIKEYKNTDFVGERPLFGSDGIYVENCSFADGESPIKESRDVTVNGCTFKWKYPMWYGKNIRVENTTLLEMARAGMWYTNGISFDGCTVHAPKSFRVCDGVKLADCVFSNAAETLWNCRNISIKNVSANGDYFAMNSENVEVDGLKLDGNYSFDGAKNVVVRSSVLNSKDAFWNSENVTVYDSVIVGEYLGWNSKDLTLINCDIESLQGLCYIENLKMINCRTKATTLALEYSTVDVDVVGRIDSVFNPSGGVVRADEIGELTLDERRIDPSKTKIIIKK